MTRQGSGRALATVPACAGFALALILSLAACAFPPSAGATAAGAGSAKRPTSSAGFPVSLNNDGKTVVIARKPQRILCVSASATQMLYAIGAGAAVVAVDKYSTYPAQAPRTSLTGDETSAEDYVRYHPDLVIVAYDEGTMVQQLARLHIPALVLAPATGLAGVYGQLSELGLATGHRAGAARAVASLRASVTAEVGYAESRGVGKSYYIEFAPQPLYTATSGTFVGAEFSLFGMRDIADKAGHGDAYPEISAEYLLSANPDWVFLADTVCCHVTPANFAQRPGFGVLGAVKDHHVVGVNDSLASQWGPHTIEQLTGFIARRLRS